MIKISDGERDREQHYAVVDITDELMYRQSKYKQTSKYYESHPT